MCVVLIHHDNRDTIPLTWTLIDTFSTDSITNNLEMIENVRTCTEDEKRIIITNGGSKYYDSMVSLNILPMEVHSNNDSMANIFLLKYVASIAGVKITMDKIKESSVTVLYVDSGILKFKECE